ncbi:protein ALP1-like [Papaver somniferum]|uniref:protein ALP1-like n=1 Tax=Papaver somniferum TaxID=3469 RepID=UPI000E7003C8|nr:protein ALP1-like [Papaver somniferum]
MEKDVFIKLCFELQQYYGLEGSRRTTAEEIVAMFLHTLGHGNVNRLTQERFQHPGETVSRYFSMMLDVVCRLAVDIIKPSNPTFRDTHKEIARDTRYMPHFKDQDCIGAIDGVHVPSTISQDNQELYIGRKGTPSQNVTMVCNFDMQFIFVCAGWEGSAHDPRILASVLANPNMEFPNPPKGKYYVVDAGYAQMDGYLGPYKGERYHILDLRRGNKPTGQKEVFNHMHSSLRSVIEHSFGVWKKKWKILRDMPSYPYTRQVQIVVPMMAIRNYIRRYATRDRHFEDADNGVYDATNEPDNEEEEHNYTNRWGSKEMKKLKDEIAKSLMGD